NPEPRRPGAHLRLDQLSRRYGPHRLRSARGNRVDLLGSRRRRRGRIAPAAVLGADQHGRLCGQQRQHAARVRCPVRERRAQGHGTRGRGGFGDDPGSGGVRRRRQLHPAAVRSAQPDAPSGRSPDRDLGAVLGQLPRHGRRSGWSEPQPLVRARKRAGRRAAGLRCRGAAQLRTASRCGSEGSGRRAHDARTDEEVVAGRAHDQAPSGAMSRSKPAQKERPSFAAMLLVLLAGIPGRAQAQGVGVETTPRPAPTPAPVTIPATAEAAILKRWGVRIEGLQLTAAGYMLDFRYTVVDARKAKPLFERKSKPVLTDEATGTVLAVPTPPKTGPLRNSYEPKAGRSYFMVFGNPRRLMRENQTATVTIGSFSVSGVRVAAPAAPTAPAPPAADPHAAHRAAQAANNA